MNAALTIFAVNVEICKLNVIDIEMISKMLPYCIFIQKLF